MGIWPVPVHVLSEVFPAVAPASHQELRTDRAHPQPSGVEEALDRRRSSQPHSRFVMQILSASRRQEVIPMRSLQAKRRVRGVTLLLSRLCSHLHSLDILMMLRTVEQTRPSGIGTVGMPAEFRLRLLGKASIATGRRDAWSRACPRRPISSRQHLASIEAGPSRKLSSPNCCGPISPVPTSEQSPAAPFQSASIRGRDRAVVSRMSEHEVALSEAPVMRPG